MTKVFYPNYTKCKYFTAHSLVHRDTLTAVWAVRVPLYTLSNGFDEAFTEHDVTHCKPEIWFCPRTHRV